MISGLKPYPGYRETGLPWIESMPAHWGQRRMKFLFRERVQKGFPAEPLLTATQSKGVIRKEDYESRTVTATKDFQLLKLVETGDFVISLRSFEGGLEVAHCRGIISPAYTVLEPRPDATDDYFARFFKSPAFISSLTLFVTGIREGQNIDYGRLSRAYMPLPPADEQAAIGRFLAWASGRLERAIRAKRKVIALLTEQKQAIIHRAVTRGLDPTVQLRPSGIHWLGEVPQHWQIVRNMALFSHRVEPGVAGLPVLQVSLRSGVTAEALDQFGRPKRLISDPTKYKRVYRGDLAYNTMRMWQGAVGVSPSDGLVSPAYVVLSPRRDICPAFYNLVFRTEVYMQQVNRQSTGIVSDRNRLYWDSFKQMQNVAMPFREQEAIVAFIDSKTSGLVAAVSQLEREIDLLREFRARLIADLVTGKLDVRDAASRLSDEAEPDNGDGIRDEGDETELFDEEADA